ncbi:MAG: hypothetical protein ACJ713_00935, partial [Candidatus Sulfotelmatobacter sp.]
GFDHSKTKFPLLGKHVKAACLDCHKTSNFKAPVEHEKCANCHQKDNPHKTQFAAQDCDACHTADGYKPSTFTISRHQTSRYKLVGKHEIVECVKCHFPAGKDADYRPAYAACRDCHKDAHGGQFTKSYEDRCDTCHTEAGFKPSTFSITRHQKTKFALAGGHSATICVECHKPVENVYPLAPARFHFEDQSCMACHADPHRERLDTPAKTGCEVCHTTRAWKRVERFDHSTTGYTLTGAHRSVECKECHRTPVSSVASQRQLLFSGAPKKCAGCHEDIHGGQFATAKGEADCAACHVEIAWKPARFDHETRSKFSLAGAHRGVSCASCHTHRELVGSRVVIRYAAAPSRCAACHASR